ncbi:MAG TPA: hypothetical protein VFG53_04030 [Anaeromyxobacter sp.]|nr:hypothetical protein [Anaeromyxobacter sp.]
MSNRVLEVRRFEVEDSETRARLEAVCVACGEDLVVVVGGGERYHVGAVALALSVESVAPPLHRTNSSYLLSVPGHKEEDLARAGSLRLSRALGKSVVVTAGVHEDRIAPERIALYQELHERLIDLIARAFEAPGG